LIEANALPLSQTANQIATEAVTANVWVLKIDWEELQTDAPATVQCLSFSLLLIREKDLPAGF